MRCIGAQTYAVLHDHINGGAPQKRSAGATFGALALGCPALHPVLRMYRWIDSRASNQGQLCYI